MAENLVKVSFGNDENFVQLSFGQCVSLSAEDPIGVEYLAALCRGVCGMPRYNGAGDDQEWTVGHHSLLVGDTAAKLAADHGMSPYAQTIAQLLGYIHDLHEAITGDVVTPVKRELGDDWRLFEGRIARRVDRGLAGAQEWLTVAESELVPWLIDEADVVVLVWETQNGIMTPSTDWRLPEARPGLVDPRHVNSKHSWAVMSQLGASVVECHNALEADRPFKRPDHLTGLQTWQCLVPTPIEEV